MSLLLDEEELEQRIKVEKVDKFEKVDKVIKLNIIFQVGMCNMISKKKTYPYSNVSEIVS